MLITCLGCNHSYDVAQYEPGQRLRCHCGQILEVPKLTKQRTVVQTFHCTTCGGNLSKENLKKGVQHCPFCDALIDLTSTRLTAYCPECFAMSPEGSRFCSNCGKLLAAPRKRPISADQVCPRCKVQMRERTIDIYQTIECPMCLGLFIEIDAFKTLIQKQETRIGTAAPTPQASSPQGKTPSQSVSYIPCPICHEIMNRTNFGRMSGVIIDSCTDHGFWLDNGELERITQWVATGGLLQKYKLEKQEAQSRVSRRCAVAHNLSTDNTTIGGGNFLSGLLDIVVDMLSS